MQPTILKNAYKIDSVNYTDCNFSATLLYSTQPNLCTYKFFQNVDISIWYVVLYGNGQGMYDDVYGELYIFYI